MNGGGALTRFSETAPRPPVFPGEENAQGQVRMETQWAPKIARRGTTLPLGPRLSPSKAYSPVLTPRRPVTIDEHDSARRFEAAEGSASTSPPLAETPPYLRWAEHLHYLLDDPDGVKLFAEYLKQENCSHLLDFWFACEGMKRQWTEDAEKGRQLIKLIFRKYIRAKKVHVSDLVRKDVNDRLVQDFGLDAHIFDAAQKEVEELMRESAYVNFLNSDVYLSYIQSMQNGPPDSPRSARSQGALEGIVKPVIEPVTNNIVESDRAAALGPLPTLHEDAELNTCHSSDVHTLPLTPSTLLATEKRRAIFDPRPKSEFCSGRIVHPYHPPPYAPYNPVSRQDSELQSLSSDAHTDDTMSLTDSSVDGISVGIHSKTTRSQQRRHHHKMRSNALMNRDLATHQTFIPRTQRFPKEQMMPQQPSEFAALLIQKLEAVKREREADEKFSRKLSEQRDGDTSGMEDSVIGGPSLGRSTRPGSECTARALAEALSKLGTSNEADTQAILDNHVQRIWSDQTPLRSPGAPSPRPWSPESNRRRLPPIMASSKGMGVPSAGSSYPMGALNHLSRSSTFGHHRRKDKDVSSTFSADSGAVLDSSEMGLEGRHFPKSTSMPETRRMFTASGAAVKKTEFGDSGLCLASDTSASSLMAPPPVPSKEKVLNWIMNSDKYQEGDRDSGATKYRSRPPSSTSPISSRRNRKQPTAAAYSNSRSESLERGGSSIIPPNQQDASAEDSLRNRPPTKPKPSLPSASISTVQSATLKKHQNSGSVTGESGTGGTMQECTVVTFTFGDEPVPYRSKIPGRTVTLKQFKDILPKKGNYKYYFKTNCEDDVALTVHQEVMDESEVLPLWEGKVLGLVKLIDS